MNENARIIDSLSARFDRAREMSDLIVIEGFVLAEWFDENGVKFHESAQHNLITTAGDNWYVARAAALSGLPAAATGMRLGTGSTAPAKTGAGAAIAPETSSPLLLRAR